MKDKTQESVGSIVEVNGKGEKSSAGKLTKLFGAAAMATVLLTGCPNSSYMRQDVETYSVSLVGEIGQREEYIKQLRQEYRWASKENRIFLNGKIKEEERILQLKKQELGRINQDLNRMNQRNRYYY